MFRKKIFLAFFFILVLGLLTASPAFAKRLLPFLRKTSGSSGTSSGGVLVSVKFRPDRLGIIVTLGNLQSATKIDYFLSYSTRGTTQGASGSLTKISTDTETREIIFGTCSHGVCRFDSGISNAKFVVTIRLSNGLKIVKSFRLKV